MRTSFASTRQLTSRVMKSTLPEYAAKGGAGSEWWTTLAYLALIVACAEMGLAGIFSAAK